MSDNVTAPDANHFCLAGDADLSLPKGVRLPFREHRRVVLGGVLLIALGVAVIMFSWELQNAYIQLFQLQERDGFVFCASFIGLLIVACVTGIFPASILGVFAGALFGLVKGFAISAGSLIIAALLAFFFGRYFFRATSRRIVSKVVNIEKLEASVAKNGWRYALLIRLAPIAPFGITSYGLGLTPIPFLQYIWTTAGSFPFLLVCVYLGSVGEVLVHHGGDIDRRLMWELSLLFTVVAMLLGLTMHFLPKLARRLRMP
jgi:uncharacterized membrane protein YdjX (TVP38/TMEM64 family)